MSIQKCSGYSCTHKERCLRYVEAKKKTKTKGKWVDADRCMDSEYDGDEMIKVAYSEMLLKGDEDAN